MTALDAAFKAIIVTLLALLLFTLSKTPEPVRPSPVIVHDVVHVPAPKRNPRRIVKPVQQNCGLLGFRC